MASVRVEMNFVKQRKEKLQESKNINNLIVRKTHNVYVSTFRSIMILNPDKTRRR